jgi:hypothetical protein
MKDLKDLVGVVEVEEDVEEYKTMEEDQFTTTIVMRRDTCQDTFLFQEDIGVLIAGITPMLQKIVKTLLLNGKIVFDREVPT